MIPKRHLWEILILFPAETLLNSIWISGTAIRQEVPSSGVSFSSFLLRQGKMAGPACLRNGLSEIKDQIGTKGGQELVEATWKVMNMLAEKRKKI